MNDLIARLRLGASISRERKLNQGYDAVADEAADRIEALQAEIEWITKANVEHVAARVELRAELTQERTDYASKCAELEIIHADCDQLRARLTALEGQKPVAWMVIPAECDVHCVAWRVSFDDGKNWTLWDTDPQIYDKKTMVQPLFTHSTCVASGAAPQQAEPKEQT